MKTPRIPVSWGELIDKITILEIKQIELSNPDALANVGKELACLLGQCQNIVHYNGDLNILKYELSIVNKILWKIEDDIRDKERKKEFDSVFIELARSVYHRNDERSRIKKKINEVTKSDLVEEKGYQSY